MKRNQVFVRARDETGRFGSADVLDLDEASFRVLILDTLFRSGCLVGIKDEYVEGEEIRLTTRPGFRFPEDD